MAARFCGARTRLRPSRPPIAPLLDAAYRRLPDDTGLRYAIRFHLHPDVRARIDLGGTAVSLALPSGETWVFRHSCAAELSLKPSVYFDSRRLTPRATKQIVLSARMKGYGVVLGWSLARPIAFMPANRLPPLIATKRPVDPSTRARARHARGPSPHACRPRNRPDPPRADFRVRQDRPRRLRQGPRRPGGGASVDRRHGAGAARRGLTVTDVADVTGFPEMMDGRVKTLHPKVHGGLLALRDDPEHVAAMEAHGIGAIDLLVVNLYPFEETVAGARTTPRHREYRHRRPGDDPRGGQEPRPCGRGRRPRGLRQADRGAGRP
jgi:hypothetical protein